MMMIKRIILKRSTYGEADGREPCYILFAREKQDSLLYEFTNKDKRIDAIG